MNTNGIAVFIDNPGPEARALLHEMEQTFPRHFKQEIASTRFYTPESWALLPDMERIARFYGSLLIRETKEEFLMYRFSSGSDEQLSPTDIFLSRGPLRTLLDDCRG